MAEDFYITALSNYDTHLFKNTPSSFQNRLAKEINLKQANWEIALCELSYKQDIKSTDDKAIIWIFDFLSKDENGYGELYKLTVDQSFIVSPHDLCSRLNNLIFEKVGRLKGKKREFFKYETNERIWITFEPDDYLCILVRYELLKLLGVTQEGSKEETLILGKTKQKKSYIFNTSEGKKVKRKFKDKYNEYWKSVCKTTDYFKYRPTLQLNHEEIVVYSTLVEPGNFGGFLAQILKILPVDWTNQGRRVTYRFGADRIYRKLVNSTNINTMGFELRTLDQQLLPLAGGDVRILIHVRVQQTR